SAATISSQVRLRLLPRARCMFDEPVQVKARRQVVTMRARTTDDKGLVFSSSATYKADGSGEIDLERGSYAGVEPMGLLWSMRADTLHNRFIKTNSLNHHVVNFSVHEKAGEGRMLAEATNERLLIGDRVNRHPIKGAYPGPFPAVLDLYVLGGGLSEKRASLLASRGFVVLTVVAYGYDDMPKKIKGVHLDYFEEAIQLLEKQDKATVGINGCCANTVLPFYHKKSQILPALMMDISKIVPTESGAFMCKNGMHNLLSEENKATLVPIKQAKGRFLFVASEDDLNWDSKAYMDQTVERLQRHGKDNFERVSYPAAGHYLEPPYGPYCPSSFHPRSHVAAEVHLWRKIQEFFRTHLIGTHPEMGSG
uniref:Uncharacterized protein n=1 Tax=Sander lucioperca TaxID=283035 RepID=A0A8C9YY54_SANLU